MSQRINVRLADSRRGSQAFVAIVAVLLLIGAGIGGVYWWSNRTPANEPVKEKTASDFVKSYLDDLEGKLKAIEKEPAKASEQVEGIKALADDEEITSITNQVKNAPAAIKATIAPMVLAKLKELEPLLAKVYAAAPGVKDQLEPLIAKILAALKGLGA